MGLSQGVRLGPYQIVARLGAGGMGTVYKATDTRLGRTVAIKVLADHAANDPQRRLRFEQEARAVSALNHPNICVLYDVGREIPTGGLAGDGSPLTESEPVQFLVMEHVEGETLSKRLREGGVSFDQALEIGAQVADALAKAHRHGIIHRDLKPGNIMLARAGAGVHVKLLDFGLAKLRQTPDPDLVSTHSKHEPDTRPGAVLGTLPYMPPEQLEGRSTDARADIFALGCVLYEMLTGRRAFGGDSEASVISAIMAHEPAPLATLQPATPAALDHLIRRCLQKDPDQRAESAHDLAEELRWLREAYRTTSDGAGHPKRRATDPASGAGQMVPGDSTARPSRRGRRWPLALGVIAVAILSYGIPAYLRNWWPWSGEPFRNAQLQEVTAQSGLQAEPAVSPDGSLIAYVSADNGTPHIWLMEAKTRFKKQLTFGAAFDHDPTWDRDGSVIFFTRYETADPSVWSVPRLASRGDEAKLELADAAQPAVSPEGDRLAFVREVEPAGESRVFVAPLTGRSKAQQITFDEEDYGLWSHSHPSWSPDGLSLCYAAQHALWKVSVDKRGATRLTSDNESATDPVWSPDGKSIYYTSSRDGTTALWTVPAAGGTPRRVTSGGGPERQPSISRNGMVLAYSNDRGDLDIVVQKLSTGEQSLLFDSERLEFMPRFMPDGTSVLFLSAPANNRIELWVKSLATGSNPGDAHRLVDLSGKEVVHPAPSRTGRWIACYRVIDDMRDIWVVSRDGSSVTQVTRDVAPDIQPAWSPDETHIAFSSKRNGRDHIWTVPMADGTVDGPEVRVTRGEGRKLAPEWSPDSQWIAYVDEPRTRDADVWVVRADGIGDARRVTSGARASRIRWVQPDRMVVSGTWGERSLSLRFVNPKTGESTPLARPVILGEDPSACDFDIDVEKDMVVFARRKGDGHLWTYTKQR